MTILLICLAVIIFLGIIRVLVRPTNDLLIDILFLDILFDLLQAILEAILDS